MELYRICKRRNADLSGKGAKIAGGRWNSPGKAVIYCSQNRALAALEYLAHFSDNVIPDDLIILSISITDHVNEEKVDKTKLPRNWKSFPGPIKLREIGDDWFKRNKTLLLKVPSVIIENEYNYLINPSQKDAGKVKIEKKEKFTIDLRLTKS